MVDHSLLTLRTLGCWNILLEIVELPPHFMEEEREARGKSPVPALTASARIGTQSSWNLQVPIAITAQR